MRGILFCGKPLTSDDGDRPTTQIHAVSVHAVKDERPIIPAIASPSLAFPGMLSRQLCSWQSALLAMRSLQERDANLYPFVDFSRQFARTPCPQGEQL